MSDQSKDNSEWSVDGVRYAHSSVYLRRHIGEDPILALKLAKKATARYDVGKEIIMAIGGTETLCVIERMKWTMRPDRIEVDFDVRAIELSQMTPAQQLRYSLLITPAPIGSTPSARP